MTETPHGNVVTIGDLMSGVLGQPQGLLALQPPAWPPDVFAVVATVLKRTGAYLCAAGGWGSMHTQDVDGPLLVELGDIQQVASAWRRGVGDGTGPDQAPARVVDWWRHLTTSDALEIPADELLANTRKEGVSEEGVACSKSVVRNLFRLLIAADEACRGAGLLDLRADADAGPAGFHLRCANNLFWRWWSPRERRPQCSPDPLSSLCEQVHPTRAVVLPKIHVSRAGLTLNNMSRHLALCDIGNDVAPVWRWIPSTYHFWQEKANINVLVIPHPPQVPPTAFTESRRGATDDNAGYFSCQPGELTEEDRGRIIAAASLVQEKHGRLDVLVLPELAMDVAEFEKLCHDLGRWTAMDLPRRDGLVVVAGVAGHGKNRATGKSHSQNKVAVSFHLAGLRVAPGSQQSKHHRWRIDGNQVRQYGLDSQLDPAKEWWEDIDISQRPVYFWSAGWLTASVLICEDLARQEPVAEVVRAVGPNLVVALLADGPQLLERWSARYAAVLADDPGCSVLTVTSLGMTKRSRPPQGKPESRVIALWKDASGGAVELPLPPDAFGLVVSLTMEPTPKTTAYGQAGTSAHGQAGSHAARLKLSGVHPVAERDLDGYSKQKLAHKGPRPMLQPYQSAALAVALVSLIRSRPASTAFIGWPAELTEFAEWLPAPPDQSPDGDLWQTVDADSQLKPLVRQLYGIGDVSNLEPWAQRPAITLNRLVERLQHRANAD
jgi:hypothetical protein